MADEQIDSLSIAISVKDNDSAKKIKGITDAIDSLVSSLKGLESVQGVLKTLENTLGAISKVGRKTTKAAASVLPPEYKEIKEETKSGKLPKIFTDKDKINKYSGNYRSLIEKFGGVRFETKKLAEDIAKSEKPVNNFGKSFKKLTRAVGRIAFYRLIRTALKEIVQSAREGFENVRQVDKQLDKTLSKLSLAGTSLKDSFASILSPILQSLEPIITRLADSLASIINRFREANAVASGQDKYVKILTSDMEEYKKAIDKANGSLLSFDTFNLLSQKSSYTGVKEMKTEMGLDEAKGLMQTLDNIKTALEGIVIVIGALVATKLVGWLTSISALITLISSVVFASGILLAIKGVKQFIDAWDDMGTWQRIISVVATLTATVVGLVVALKLLHGNWLGAIGVAAAVGGIVAGLSDSLAKNSKSFANGGSFNTADMFFANENGQTELIASTNNGGAVMNMEQLQGAIYNGMIMAMADSGGKEIVLKVDQNTLGRVVANSTGFISETNRIKLIKV